MPKNLSLILNVILLLAVGILYYLHFSSPGPVQQAEAIQQVAADKDSTGVASPVIYYINTDSLTANYEFAKELDQRLKDKRSRSEKQFETEARKFEKDVMKFRENARFMTQTEGEQRKEELMVREQDLANLEEELSKGLLEDQQRLNDELRERILTYLRNSRKNRNFSYVLGYSERENNILVGDSSLDITIEILNGLNEEYREGKKKEKK